MNWGNKINKLEKLLCQWKQRKLTMFGKVVILKSLAISQINYYLNILEVKEDVIKKLESIFYSFLWDKKERIKRKTLIARYENGGLCMPDIRSIISASRAAWISRIYEKDNLSLYVLNEYLKNINLNAYLLKNSYFTNIKEISNVKMPIFYKEVFVAFNNCKYIKEMKNMNDFDFMTQLIWCNSLFKFKGQCLLFNSWINSGILYVKDLFTEKGTYLTPCEMLSKLKNKQNWISEYKIIKKTLKPYIKKYSFDFSKCKYINIKDIKEGLTLCTGKNMVTISNKKSKFFYDILIEKRYCRPITEKTWQKEFTFIVSHSMWKDIYMRNFVKMIDKKLCEFRFKLLHNMLICNDKLYRWKLMPNNECTYCKEKETIKHLLFDCNRVNIIWKEVGNIMKVDVQWKHIVLGFSEINVTMKTRNILCTIITYAIYIFNYKIKFERAPILMIFLKGFILRYQNVFKQLNIQINNHLLSDISRWLHNE